MWVFKGLNCGCVVVLQHSDNSEVQPAVSLLRVCRDNTWTALLFPSEQEKAPVKRAWPNLSEFLMKERMQQQREKPRSLPSWILFSIPWKPHSAVLWLAQLLIHLQSSGRVRLIKKPCGRSCRSGGKRRAWKKSLISLRESSNSSTRALILTHVGNFNLFVGRVCLAEKDGLVSLHRQTSCLV